MKEKLRSLRTLQDGNENRGELFALTRVLPNARPVGLPVYVAPVPAGSILVAASGIGVSPFFLALLAAVTAWHELVLLTFAEGSCQNHLPSRLSTIHYLKPVSLFGFQKVCTSFVAPTLVIPAQANL